MAYPKIRISLETAQYIFSDAGIQADRDDSGKAVCYRGQSRNGSVFIDRSLSELCKRLWDTN